MKKIKKIGPYILLSSKEVYKNKWICVQEDKVIHANGKKGIFGIVNMKAGSTILAINDAGEVYLVEEYNYGIKQNSIYLISGGLEKKETPLATAKRELKEEVGLEAKKWINLGVINPFSTVINSPNYMFLALGIKKGKSHLDDEEILKVIKKPFYEVVEMVMENKITHGASCTAILKAYKYFKDQDKYKIKKP